MSAGWEEWEPDEWDEDEFLADVDAGETMTLAEWRVQQPVLNALKMADFIRLRREGRLDDDRWMRALGVAEAPHDLAGPTEEELAARDGILARVAVFRA